MSIITLHTANLDLWNNERKEYLRYQYDLSSNDVVIDLGAYQGEFSKEIYSRYKCKCVVVEPSEYIRDFKDGEIINKAASTHKGVLQFGGRAYYASIFEPTDHEYECFDVNELLTKYEDISLLKINIEGAEYDLLNHIIDHGYIKRVRNLQVQFHQIEGCPYERWYEELEKKLQPTHEKEWGYEFVWESWKRKN